MRGQTSLESSHLSDSPDSDFHQAIQENYVQLLQDSPPEVVSFSLEEVSECINSLNAHRQMDQMQLNQSIWSTVGSHF